MTRVHTQEDTLAILDDFQKHGHADIDTARIYGEALPKSTWATCTGKSEG